MRQLVNPFAVILSDHVQPARDAVLPQTLPPPERLPVPAAGPTALAGLADKAAQKYGVDPCLVRAVIHAESRWNPAAVSPAGASGLMQLMPATAKSLGVTDIFDPSQNIDGGVRFLAGLLKKYGSVDVALAAYNFGPGNVDKGRSWPKETRDYVASITSRLGGTVRA